MRPIAILSALLLAAAVCTGCRNADTAVQTTAESATQATTAPEATAEATAPAETAAATQPSPAETTPAVSYDTPTVYDGQIDISDFEDPELPEPPASAATDPTEQAEQPEQTEPQTEPTTPTPTQPATEPDGYQSVVVRP